MVMTPSLPVLLIPGLACTPSLYAGQMPALWTFGPVTVADHRRADSMDAIARQILAEAPPVSRSPVFRWAAISRLRSCGWRRSGWQNLRCWTPDRAAITPEASETPQGVDRAWRRPANSTTIIDTLWPILVHKDRQGDAALKRIVCDMAKTAGADAFVRQQQRDHDAAGFAPWSAAISDVRRWCWSARAISSRRPPCPRKWRGSFQTAGWWTCPTCGHLSTLERPEAVTRALVEWMEA